MAFDAVQDKQAPGSRLTMSLRLAMFLLLLVCGDVESNPGPNDKV